MLLGTTRDSAAGQEKERKSQSIPQVFCRKEKLKFKTCSPLFFIAFPPDVTFYLFDFFDLPTSKCSPIEDLKFGDLSNI